MKKEKTAGDIIDVEYTIRPKNSAVAIREALGVPESKSVMPEKNWKELEDIYFAAANSIIQIGVNVNAAIAQPYVAKILSTNEEFLVAHKGLIKDLDAFTDRLANIHSKHCEHKGVIKSQEDNILAINCFEEYINWDTQFKAVTLPTVLTIMDHVGAVASEILKQEVVEEVQTSTDSTSEVTTDNTVTIH